MGVAQPPFFGNRGIGQVYIFQMSERPTTGVLFVLAKCMFHSV